MENYNIYIRIFKKREQEVVLEKDYKYFRLENILEKRKRFKRIVLILDIFLLIISCISYRYIYAVETGKLIYSEETEKFIAENKTPVFSIEKIILYSSADWIDNSDEKLQSIDISQFTDIEIFINNKGRSEEITAENTVSKIYIDSIQIDADSRRRRENIKL